MSLNNNQRWRLEKILKEVVKETSKGYAVNYEKTINEIEEITLNPSTVPACPMLQRQGIKLSACHKVMIGEEECKDCYSDLKVNLLGKDSSKKEEVI